MPKQSSRGTQLAHSPIRSLMPYAIEAKAQGKKIFHLNIGQPDIPTPPKALERIRNNEASIVSYGPSGGMPALRAQVATYYQKFDVHLQQEDVFVTTGASEAILFALFAGCDAGDEIIIPEPFYANYLGFASTCSVRIIPITSTLASNFSLPKPEVFEALIGPKTKAIFLCNPGNPTGQLYSQTDLMALMQIVKKHDLFLIVDEVYKEFCYDQRFTSALSFAGMSDHVIVLDSISKVFSSCGARVGFLISKNKGIQASVEKYAQLRLCPPYFGQQLALACFEDSEAYIAEAKEEYRRRRKALFDALSKIPGLQCSLPEAAFYIIVALPIKDAAAFCKWLLTDFSRNGKTVMLAPAEGFYFNQEIGKSQVRIAYILNEQDLQEAILCLEEALNQYRRLFPEAVSAARVAR